MKNWEKEATKDWRKLGFTSEKSFRKWKGLDQDTKNAIWGIISITCAVGIILTMYLLK